MLYAILGDIHGNIQALSAVLEDADAAGAEQFLSVGDIVGYGANPRECLEIMRNRGTLAVAGNHDWGVVGKVSTEYFNADARDSIDWTRRQLSAPEIAELEAAELIRLVGDITLVHSTLFSPDYFEYIQTIYDVQLTFAHLSTGVCFVGHSHVPVMFLDTEPIDYFLQPVLELPAQSRAIINVGSVGQPRDLDPRASYALYDDQTRMVTMRRVDYDVQSASQSMAAAGLPATNAARIMLGR